MTWAVIYTAKPAAGEPGEGGEYAHGRQEWQGEEHDIAYDETYDRMPRIQLSAKNIVAGTVVVTLKDGRRRFELVDYTTDTAAGWYQSWPVPEPHICYLHRRQGDSYDEAWLYFNPDLAGKGINVDYDYYETEAEIKTFVVCPDGKLAVNEAGPRHRFLTIAGTTVAVDYSPRFGDTDLEVACASQRRLFGISSPSWLLVSRGNYWTGYVSVPVVGQDAPIWQLAAALARAGDCYLFAQGPFIILRNRDTYSEISNLSYQLEATSQSIGPYKTVVFAYANGEVSAGSGKPILSLAAPHVWDKGHAQALCDSAFTYYAEERKEYIVRCNGILDDEVLLAVKKFTFEGETVTGHVKKIRFTPNNTTEFYIVGIVNPRLEAT